ncbi:hypothetical protein [Streptomyces natalensis]|nr:hypothetical protein [Streptomyces natalensis]
MRENQVSDNPAMGADPSDAYNAWEPMGHSGRVLTVAVVPLGTGPDR